MKVFKAFVLLFLFLNSVSVNYSYSQFSPAELYAKGLEKFYDGEFTESIKFFDDYIKVNTNDIRGFNYRGLSYLALKNYNKAIEDFTSMLTINTTYAPAFTNRGYAYLLQGNLSSSNSDFSNSIQYGPDFIEGYIGKSRTLVALGKFPDAIKALDRAKGVEPKNSRIYVNKAWTYYLLNDTNNFFDNVYTALYYDSNIVFTSFERDLIFLKVEVFKNALDVANESVQKYPDNYFFMFARGFIYYLMNNYKEATNDFKASVKLNKNKSDLYIQIMSIILRSIDRNS